MSANAIAVRLSVDDPAAVPAGAVRGEEERSKEDVGLPPTPLSFGRRIVAGGEWLFGVAALMVGLSLVAVVPVLQLMSLGYMLEAGGRVARSGASATGSSESVQRHRSAA